MPSSAVHSFTDPDAFASLVRANRAEVTVTGRGNFSASLAHVDFKHLWIQRLTDSLPRIMHSTTMTGRAVISFRAQPGLDLTWCGIQMLPTNLVRLTEGQDAFHRSLGDCTYASMSLPFETVSMLGETVVERDLMPQRRAVIVTPKPFAMVRLQRLHATAAELAREAPEIIASSEAAGGLEQALIWALIACLDTADLQQHKIVPHRHATIMRRFRDVVEANTSTPIYLAELCGAVGVSARTLQACCQEHIGMSPLRFLWLRRMHLVRRALAMAEPTSRTVTEIAGTFGFWELGRFAVAYRQLFGIQPNMTLRRPPED